MNKSFLQCKESEVLVPLPSTPNDGDEGNDSSSTLSYTVSNPDLASPVGENFMRVLSFSSNEEEQNISTSGGPDHDTPLVQDGHEVVLSIDFIKDNGEKQNSNILHGPRMSTTSLYSNISASAHTTVTSNTGKVFENGNRSQSPPRFLGSTSAEREEEEEKNRSIFGNQTRKKYNIRKIYTPKRNGETSPMAPLSTDREVPIVASVTAISCMQSTAKKQSTPTQNHGVNGDGKNFVQRNPPMDSVNYTNQGNPMMSPLTPPRINGNEFSSVTLEMDSDIGLPHLKTPSTPADCNGIFRGNELNEHEKTAHYVHFEQTPLITNKRGRIDTGDLAPQLPVYHANDLSSPPTSLSKPSIEGHHAQAFLLSLAFFALWTPQNLLAPNLTQAAVEFGYGNDTVARDLYLGSNLALASSVLSLPFSGCIGFASDAVSSRKVLISLTALVGGLSAIGTAMANTYPQLIFARFVNGACMSGSVPVVFSLLSDWFDDEERNAASSGFTAMMGAGIILGQIFSGCTGPSYGWRFSFFVSGFLTILLAVLVMGCLRDPERGGKEKVLREMMAIGRKYDRKLTWGQFVSAMTNHSSNCLLMLQGFFSNIPWGIMFVFLNDCLSQEMGLSVEAATFIVGIFGIGCATGGILGGYLGQLATGADRKFLPIFMAVSTFFGIGPFVALLGGHSYNRAGWLPCLYSFSGGCIASLPSVNIRPCIINCNPPEIRGAALTTANLIINLARGAGPSCLTSMISIWGVSRVDGFNILVTVFWTITAIQLALLSKTLPVDQDRMEKELASYAISAITNIGNDYCSLSHDDCNTVQNELFSRSDIGSYCGDTTVDGDISLFSIENQSLSFDATAAKQSL
eukprot:CAMPEP_0171335518 /NCGR_PEP_ID=MMETSP0878-20121228/5386_1 /TAXON_ID=67004 /ORGANISM="Thalassiosira weissflogii, Strain CCMP1336" /LENGTH=855 /DNA_ID=CAMNT_0011836795 /DNA_START=87 /DNA_END=2651 /DNA_ORIENTATION=+